MEHPSGIVCEPPIKEYFNKFGTLKKALNLYLDSLVHFHTIIQGSQVVVKVQTD